jgi:GDP-6-deoxy-D-talose 4-dehydrogenase
MKILITGSNGFVGTYLKNELLATGKDVWGIDFKSYSHNTFSANIMNENALIGILKQVEPDYIIHLAAIADVDQAIESQVYEINFKGTLNVLNACIQLKKIPRFVFISSSLVYGNIPVECLPIDESFAVNPVNHYGASKAAAEIAVKTFGCEYGLEYVIIRPFNHTGPGQTEKFVVPKIVNAFRNGDSHISLGDTNTIRDFTDVRDIVKAYSGIIQFFKNGEIYNVASGKGITVSNIVEKLEQISGRAITIDKKEFLLRKSEIKSIVGNAEKIRKDIGWQAIISIDETLNAMFCEH